MKITRISLLSQKTNTMDIDVTQEQLDRWERGELIQIVMPNLTPDEREFIKTGILPQEWNNIFQAV